MDAQTGPDGAPRRLADVEIDPQYERARLLVLALTGELAARLHTTTDRDEQARLAEQINDVQAVKRSLAVDDHERIAEIVSTYPDRIAAVQTGATADG